MKKKASKGLLLSLVALSLISLGFSSWIFGTAEGQLNVDISSSQVVDVTGFLTYNKEKSKGFELGDGYFVQDGLISNTANLVFTYTLDVAKAMKYNAITLNTSTNKYEMIYLARLSLNKPHFTVEPNGTKAPLYTGCSINTGSGYKAATNVKYAVEQNLYNTYDKFVIGDIDVNSPTKEISLKYDFSGTPVVQQGQYVLNFHMRLEQVRS